MKKKILIINNNLNLGGAEKSLTALLPLLSQDYQIDLMLLEKKGELLESIDPSITIIENHLYTEMMKGIIYHLHNKNWRIAKNLFMIKLFYKTFSMMSYKKFASYYLDSNLDSNYDCVIGFLEGMSSLIASNVKAKKHIYWMHTDYEKQTIDKRAYAKLYSKADAIMCVSQQAKAQLQSIFSTIANKIHYIPNVIDKKQLLQLADAFPVQFEQTGVQFLSVARLSHLKGHIRMLDVIYELKKRNYDFHWHFIGDGEDKDIILQHAQDLGVSDKCTFYGALTNPYPYVKACDCFMIPSLAEGFGMALTEALLLSKYSIATCFNGAYEQIPSNDLLIGEVIDNTQDAILQACINMIEKPKQFKGHFEYDVANTTIQIIKSIIE